MVVDAARWRYVAVTVMSGSGALHLTGMSSTVASVSAEVANCDDPPSVDLAALDAWYRRYMTFEIVSLAGALQYFTDGTTLAWFRALLLLSCRHAIVDDVSLPGKVSKARFLKSPVRWVFGFLWISLLGLFKAVVKEARSEGFWNFCGFWWFMYGLLFAPHNWNIPLYETF